MKILTFIFVLLFVTGCGGDSIVHVSNNIYLISGDTEYDMSLSAISNESGLAKDIIGPCVFGVGNNSSYIIAKQHPRHFPDMPSKDTTFYFIIPITNEYDSYESPEVIGPLSKKVFKIKRDSLGIPANLDFNLVFKNLE